MSSTTTARLPKTLSALGVAVLAAGLLTAANGSAGAATGNAHTGTAERIAVEPGEALLLGSGTVTPASEASEWLVLARNQCSQGYACFFKYDPDVTGNASVGHKCSYSTNTRNADQLCSWMHGFQTNVYPNGYPVGGIYNKSSKRVYYWTNGTCSGDRIGSTASNTGGGLAGTYKVKGIKFGSSTSGC
ncbi:hypothetical protein [Streptomyces cyaneus]|uniref:hypothetical protein n=1 Tax=Streptomyces cyaneus TaxID=1904 RepID=UPI000FF88EBB|nr:hypothetical protein [Streptomyces cyaneus]